MTSYIFDIGKAFVEKIQYLHCKKFSSTARSDQKSLLMDDNFY